MAADGQVPKADPTVAAGGEADPVDTAAAADGDGEGTSGHMFGGDTDDNWDDEAQEVEIVEEQEPPKNPTVKTGSVDDDIEYDYVPSPLVVDHEEAQPTARPFWIKVAAGFAVSAGSIIGTVMWVRRKCRAAVAARSQAAQAAPV